MTWTVPTESTIAICIAMPTRRAAFLSSPALAGPTGVSSALDAQRAPPPVAVSWRVHGHVAAGSRPVAACGVPSQHLSDYCWPSICRPTTASRSTGGQTASASATCVSSLASCSPKRHSGRLRAWASASPRRRRPFIPSTGATTRLRIQGTRCGYTAPRDPSRPQTTSGSRSRTVRCLPASVAVLLTRFGHTRPGSGVSLNVGRTLVVTRIRTRYVDAPDGFPLDGGSSGHMDTNRSGVPIRWRGTTRSRSSITVSSTRSKQDTRSSSYGTTSTTPPPSTPGLV